MYGPPCLRLGQRSSLFPNMIKVPQSLMQVLARKQFLYLLKEPENKSEQLRYNMMSKYRTRAVAP